MSTFIVVLVIFAVLFTTIWYLISLPQRRRSKKHSEALQNAGLEISFISQGNRDPFVEEKAFPRHQQSLSWMGGKFSNVMQGSSSLGKTWLFEYSYETGSGESLSTYRQTVAAFLLRDISLPAFSLRPAKILQKIVPLNFLQKAIHALRRSNVIFELNPSFSRDYELSGPDEDALRSLFQPTLLEYWESLPTNEKWSADGSMNWVIVFRDNTLIPPNELRPFLHRAQEIAALFQNSSSPYPL